MNVVAKPAQRTPLAQMLTRDEWRRMAAMFGFILFLHVSGALLMWQATSGRYELSDGTLFGWGTAALAYTLGMRHACKTNSNIPKKCTKHSSIMIAPF